MMSETPDTTGTGDTDPEAAARRNWFASHGYTGDEPTVRLRNGDNVAPRDVWDVWRGLNELYNEFPGLFHRVAHWAEAGRTPMDSEGVLLLPKFGSLTNPSAKPERITGGYEVYPWSELQRRIVCALTAYNDVDTCADFVTQPFAQRGPNAL